MADPAKLWADVYGTTTPLQQASIANQTSTPATAPAVAQDPATAGAQASAQNSALPGVHNGNPANGYYDAYAAHRERTDAMQPVQPTQPSMDQSAWSAQAQAQYAAMSRGAPAPREGSLPGPYTAPVMNADGYSTDFAAMGLDPPGAPASPNPGSGGNINAGAPGYMPIGWSGQQGWGLGTQTAAQQQGPPGTTQGGRAATSLENDPALIAALGNLGGQGAGRAPGAGGGPGAPGAGAQSIRDGLGVQGYQTLPAGQATQQPPPGSPGVQPLGQGYIATETPAVGLDPVGGYQPAVEAVTGAQINADGTPFDPANPAKTGGGSVTPPPPPPGAGPGFTWEGAGFGRPGFPDPTPGYVYQGPGTDVGHGQTIDPNILQYITDPGVATMVAKYNDKITRYNALDEVFQRGDIGIQLAQQLNSLSRGLEGFGFNVAFGNQDYQGTPGAEPPPLDPGDATRPGIDLGNGLPVLSTGQLPNFFANMFDINGPNATLANRTAAWDSYLDAYREDRGATQQQMGVNELDALMSQIENNPLRTGAQSQALELAEMGDPTNYDLVRSKAAQASAQDLDTLAQVMGQRGARSGFGAGSMAGTFGELGRQNRGDLSDRLGDISMLEDRGAYDYKARGIDALTNTFAATQNPMTQARMMLAQAMMGQAPYGGSFGGGTSLFDAGTGIDAIRLAEGAADKAGSESGWVTGANIFGSLLKGAGGFM